MSPPKVGGSRARNDFGSRIFEIDLHRGDVGQQEQHCGPDLFGDECRTEVLVDDGLHAFHFASRVVDHGYSSTAPAHDDRACVEETLDLRHLDDTLRTR